MASNFKPRRFKQGSETLPTLAALDTRNTDRYYRSGDVSAIAQTAAHTRAVEAHKKEQARRRANVNPLAPLDERDTDRIYRSDATPPRQLKHMYRRMRQVKRDIPQGSSTTPVNHPQAVHPLTVLDANKINEVVTLAINKVREGHPRVIITAGNGLSMKINTRLDSLMTRSHITEEERYSVTIKLLPKDKAPAAQTKAPQVRTPETRTTTEMLGTPKPAAREAVSRKLTQDPADFLTAPDVPEESELAPPPAMIEEAEVVQVVAPEPAKAEAEDNDMVPPPEAITDSEVGS